MEFLGIGPMELVLILIIALIVLGPNDMVKAGRTIGKFLRGLVMSDTWRAMTKLRTLPNQLMREAGVDEAQAQLQKDLQEVKADMEIGKTEIDIPDLSDWTSPQPQVNSINPPKLPGSVADPQETENNITENLEVSPSDETDQK